MIKNSTKTKKTKIIAFTLLGTLCITCATAAGLLGRTTKDALAATFSDATIETRYTLNNELSIPAVKATVDGAEYDTSALLKFPDGKIVATNNAVLSQGGEYQLIYRATVDGKVYEKTYSFVVNDNLYYCTGNKSSAEYATRTYQKSDDDGNLTDETVDLTGIYVTLTNGSVFKYSKILDLSKLTADDLLIKYYILPERVGSVDLNMLRVKLTDIYDPDNYITLTAKHNTNNSNAMTVVNASNGQSPTGIERDAKNAHSSAYINITYNGENYYVHRNNKFGTYVNGKASFDGTPVYGDITSNAIEFYYDYDSKTVYNNVNVIADLDDIAMFKRPWSGFTTGEVFLTIEGAQFNNSSAEILITDILNENFTENVYVDDGEPIITVDFGEFTEATLPSGVVGEKYALFTASAMDKETSVADFKTKVYYNYSLDNRTESMIYDGGYFIPTKVGVYTVEYSATDVFGNRAIKTVDISVMTTENGLKIDLGSDYSATGITGVGASVKDYTLSHIRGTANVIVKAVINDESTEIYKGSATTASGLTFVPLYTGTYKIVYEYGDYVFNETKEYEMTVTSSDKPYLDYSDVSFPDYLVKGSKYSFGKGKAYAFDNGETKEAACYLAVYDDGAATPVLYSDFSAVTITATSSVKLRFYAVNATVSDPNNVDFNSSDVSYEDFDIPVIDAGLNTESFDMSKFFVTNGFNATATENAINFTTTADALSERNAGFRFVNDVYLYNFGLRFTFDKSSFAPFTIALSDAQTKEKVLTFDYSYKSGNVVFSLNGGTGYTVAAKTKEFITETDTDKKTFTFYNGTTAVLETTLNGKPIEDILGRKLFLTFEFTNVTENFAFNVTKLGNQNLSNGKDLTSPMITSVSVPASFKIGSTYEIPVLYAYDVLNPDITFTITVKRGAQFITNTDGVQLNRVSPEQAGTILLDKYGDYLVTYEASDGSNLTTKRIPLYVADDVKPTITLSKFYATSCALGGTIKVATATVEDNVSEDLTIDVYVIAPNGKIEAVENGGDLTANVKGKYTVYYYAADEEGNVTFEHYEITVG